MYQIYADNTLIYDSTLEDYKIGSGQITKELDKSGSFVFSVYPDHFFYNQFVALKTVITVYKSGRIVFRGRVLSDKVDYWNNKVLTCEGELGFLQDSVVRPYDFQGAPAALLSKFIADHNSQVDEFKRFKLGTVDIQDGNDYINRSSVDYSATLSMMGSALTGSALGGHFYITHGDDGTDPVPTLHYLRDFSKVSMQSIEFGENLKDYVRTADATELATAIVPLGSTAESTGKRTTIESANGGKDYVYSEAGVALRGWIFKTVVWDDVAVPGNLKTKAEAYLDAVVNQNITIELNAIDQHLIDPTIESIDVCEYVRARSAPHGLDAVMLCNKQTMDLLRPGNDTVVLGFHAATFTGAFTGARSQMEASVSTLGKTVSAIKQDAYNIELSVEELGKSMSAVQLQTNSLSLSVTNKGTTASIQLLAGDEKLGTPVTIELTGLVKFTDLGANGTTVIDGSRIKSGQIEAQYLKLTGALSFGDLKDADVIQQQFGLGADAVTTITENAINTASISAYQITGGVLSGIRIESESTYNDDYFVAIEDGIIDFNGRGSIGYLGRSFLSIDAIDGIVIGSGTSGDVTIWSEGTPWHLTSSGWQRG